MELGFENINSLNLSLIKEGDAKELTRLYSILFKKASNILMERGGNDDIMDILQEAVIDIYNNAEIHIKRNEGKFINKDDRVFKFALLRRWIHRDRDYARIISVDFFDDDLNKAMVPSVESTLIVSETSKTQWDAIQKAMAALNPVTKMILELFYFQELKDYEIAEKLGFNSRYAVKIRRVQGIRKIRHICTSKGDKELENTISIMDHFGI